MRIKKGTEAIQQYIIQFVAGKMILFQQICRLDITIAQGHQNNHIKILNVPLVYFKFSINQILCFNRLIKFQNVNNTGLWKC